MKTVVKTVVFWISTVLVSAFMLFVAFSYLTHQPKMMSGMASLGYPAYFPNILGIFKILGAIMLLIPGFPRLKEWAYAGFSFTFIGAFCSHLAINQNQEALAPLIALVVLLISYFTRPLSRQMPFAAVIATRTTVVEPPHPVGAAR